MRALFFWRSTSAVDLEPLAERDGIRWRWCSVADDRIVRVRERLSARVFVFRSCSTHLRSPAFVEDGLDVGEALAAWEKGDGR